MIKNVGVTGKKKKNAGGEFFFFFIFKILIIKTDLKYHNKFKIVVKSLKISKIKSITNIIL